MSAIQLDFNLRTTSNVKTVHLIGSWDGYQGQLPLSRDGKKGSWKGTFRFQAAVICPGQRYWFYYMLDGYQVSHDPSRDFTTEPTTGRKLNTLDVPAEKNSKHSSSTKRSSRRYSREVPRGRPADAIVSPRPQRPNQTKHLVQGDYTQATLAALTQRLTLDEESEDDDSSDIESDCDSDVPSLTSGSSRSSRSSNCTSPSSVSSGSSTCTCERYGITRSGQRVKLDCGGQRCGYSDQESCSSEDEDAEYRYRVRSTRRHAVVIE
jgi:hypothetical protein